MAEVDTHEVRRLRAEIARLQAAVDALAKVAGLFYTAGRADALTGAHAKPPRKRPPRDRDRTNLHVVRIAIPLLIGVAILMAGPMPVFSQDRQYRSPGYQAHVLRAEPRPPGRRWQDYHFVTPADQCPANTKLEACEARKLYARMIAEEAGLCDGPGQLPDLGKPRVEGIEAREKRGESPLGVVGDEGLDLLAFGGECSQLRSQPGRGGQAAGRVGGVVQALHNAGRYVPVEQDNGAEHLLASRRHARVPGRARPVVCRPRPQRRAAHPACRYPGQQVLAGVGCVAERGGLRVQHGHERLPLLAREDGVPCCR